jgi:hypothetical protein
MLTFPTNRLNLISGSRFAEEGAIELHFEMLPCKITPESEGFIKQKHICISKYFFPNMLHNKNLREKVPLMK